MKEKRRENGGGEEGGKNEVCQCGENMKANGGMVESCCISEVFPVVSSSF